MSQIILASQSPFRQQQLKEAGLEFQAQASQVDESELKSKGLKPVDLCRELAKAKCLDVAKNFDQDHFVIGADQIASIESEILGKTEGPEQAAEQLMKLSGKTHELLTAICISHKGQLFEYTDITTLTMKSISSNEALAYVKKDESWDCAGSYKIEANGRQLFEHITSHDESAIIGLPMKTVFKQLKKAGLSD